RIDRPPLDDDALHERCRQRELHPGVLSRDHAHAGFLDRREPALADVGRVEAGIELLDEEVALRISLQGTRRTFRTERATPCRSQGRGARPSSLRNALCRSRAPASWASISLSCACTTARSISGSATAVLT